jgi:membrane protein YdbS with pleckstrin-like domain
MKIVRIIVSIVIALFALLFWYSALTVPAFAATSYLILAIVLTVATYFVSPWRFRRTKGTTSA